MSAAANGARNIAAREKAVLLLAVLYFSTSYTCKLLVLVVIALIQPEIVL